jgi:hypothetical protein
MKPLYAIAEAHFGLPPSTVDSIVKSIPSNTVAKRFYYVSSKRVAEIREFLESYKPRLFFCEGDGTGGEIEAAGYPRGNIIYLDDDFKPYLDHNKELRKIIKDVVHWDETGDGFLRMEALLLKK